MKKYFWALIIVDIIFFVCMVSLLTTDHVTAGIIFAAFLGFFFFASLIAFIVAYDERPENIQNASDKSRIIINNKHNSPTLKNDSPTIKGYDYLKQMGASWFVSFSFHIYIDEKHNNYKKIKTVELRREIFNDTTQYHMDWLRYISRSMSARKLNTNELGLSGNQIKNMAFAVLNKRELAQKKYEESAKSNYQAQIHIENEENKKNVILYVGDKVIHKTYGEGTIKSIDGEHIIVDFKDNENKMFQTPDSFNNGFLTKVL